MDWRQPAIALPSDFSSWTSRPMKVPSDILLPADRITNRETPIGDDVILVRNEDLWCAQMR